MSGAISFMVYVYFGLFVGVTAVHLWASYRRDTELRGITKGMLLLLLLGFYLELTPSAEWSLVAALLMSWLGDLFLIGRGVKWFAAGGASFGLSHLFYILTYSRTVDFRVLPLWLMIGCGVLFTVSVLVIFRKLKGYLPKALLPLMAGYLLVNGFMNCFAWFRLFSHVNVGTVVTVIGAVLFFVSDTALFFVRFNKQSRMKSHFLVMLTYTLGEFLIVLGLVL